MLRHIHKISVNEYPDPIAPLKFSGPGKGRSWGSGNRGSGGARGGSRGDRGGQGGGGVGKRGGQGSRGTTRKFMSSRIQHDRSGY